MTHETPLGPGAEFDAIRAMLVRFGNVAEGVGDDAAILRVPRGEQLVVSTDSSTENLHFRRGWLTPEEIGYRAVAAALSDLAAMAAMPLGVLISLGVPRDWREHLGGIADGIRECVGRAGTVVRGGNVSGSAELTITTTVLGSAFSPLRRSTAKPGERVYVTGTLGGPASALRSFEAGGDGGEHRARFAHPIPRLREARWLAARGASAAIDISDGLVADARHLAAASGVVIELAAERVPRCTGTSVQDGLAAGEEYELLFTSPEALDANAFMQEFRLPLTDIGVVGSLSGDPHVIVDGKRVADVRGHDHFSR